MEGQRRRRAIRRKIRMGFICGKEDGDLVTAAGVPEKFWVSSAVCEDYEGKNCEPFWMRDTVHTDVAIWWYVASRYRSTVEAELLVGPTDVTAARLARNDVNVLLGWDAVSAHLEESQDPIRLRGHGARMASLLRKPQSRVWPPASLRDLCDNKGDYMKLLEARGIPIAPTFVYESRIEAASDEQQSSSSSSSSGLALPPAARRRRLDSGGGYALIDEEDSTEKKVAASKFAEATVKVARERGWEKIVVKPSPSSWSRGVETFQKLASEKTRKDLELYFDSVKDAKQIIVQRHLKGLEDEPETRCFFFGREFLYAVANATFCTQERDDEARLLAVTDHPESATDAPLDSERRLPSAYFERHRALATRVVDALPPCKALDGTTALDNFPCLLRVDIGLHDAKDLINVQQNGHEGGEKKTAVFVNEIEPVPTLYLDPKFGHAQDFVAEYADRIVAAAADALGVFPPPTTSSSPSSSPPPPPGVAALLDDAAAEEQALLAAAGA